MIRLAWFFLKIVTELIGIGFLIIKTDSYRLESVFRFITVRIGRLGRFETLKILFKKKKKKNPFNLLSIQWD